MSAFEVGQIVECVDVGTNRYITLGRHYVVRAFDHSLGQEYVEIIGDDGDVSSYYAERFRQTTIPTSYRNTDPATSKGKRKVNKYEQAVLDMLRGGTNGYPLANKSWALTGKEIAIQSGNPLNCITPRFAPLRRKGLIKALEVPIEWNENRLIPKYVKRDKQIVWVLA